MARIKLQLPEQFPFETIIPIRITDLNYGGHVGNDTILSIVHEARLQFLKNAGYSELNLEGAGLIMSDVSIQFKQELFYGESVRVEIAASEFSRVGFELYYRLSKTAADKSILVAIAKTGMVCYDYTNKKISAVPAGVKERLEMNGSV